jgi:hypothetical protein
MMSIPVGQEWSELNSRKSICTSMDERESPLHNPLKSTMKMEAACSSKTLVLTSLQHGVITQKATI